MKVGFPGFYNLGRYTYFNENEIILQSSAYSKYFDDFEIFDLTYSIQYA